MHAATRAKPCAYAEGKSTASVSQTPPSAPADRPAPGGDGLESFLGAAAASHIAHRGCLPRLWSSPDTDALRHQVRDVMLQLFLDAQEHHRVRADADISDVDLVLWSLSGVIETTHGESTTA